ncbi:MAG: class I SAM-dependent methyltransferase [Neisseria sp.]|nr:class I SAM-dependent methyltransferase [Neisseria sp.]
MNFAQLPEPSSEALAASLSLQNLIRAEIQQNNGWISFARFMELALYAPQFGYYTGGSHKIGAAGDFITAPTLSPLFGQTLARQIAQVLPHTAGNVYEFGAGTGALASQILNTLPQDAIQNYYIIELSSELSERQQQFIAETAPEMAKKVVHLRELPEAFDGIIIGNEVLDAMPVELMKQTADGIRQIGVSWQDEAFVVSEQEPNNPQLIELVQQYFPAVAPYTSELHIQQNAFVQTLAGRLQRGGMIWMDYGFDATQYYHPQRADGTFIGHYRHHTVHDPFFHIGLTDLTAHVNFTDIAQAGCDAGLDLIGYLPQSHFLLNLGITDLLEQSGEPDSPAYIQAAHTLHKLIGQHEMGELFKVIAFAKNLDIDWQGFEYGDLCHKL